MKQIAKNIDSLGEVLILIAVTFLYAYEHIIAASILLAFTLYCVNAQQEKEKAKAKKRRKKRKS